MRWPWQKRPKGHKDPVPVGIFRLVVLDDNPYPTFIGTRPWCDGTPYWAEDRSCRCTHTDDAP